MLLRSSSTPILKSWIPPYYTNPNSSPTNINEPTLTPPCLSRTTSISTHSPPSTPPSPTTNTNHSTRASSCTLFDHRDFSDQPYPKSKPLCRLFSSLGIDEAVPVAEDGGGVVCSGDGKGTDGGDWYGGGGSGFNGYSYYSGNSNGPGNIEAYYKKMIKAHPGNPLLLGNYARFLKDLCSSIICKFPMECGRGRRPRQSWNSKIVATTLHRRNFSSLSFDQNLNVPEHAVILS
ncbi:uncharacterized protein [Spinacia oleracea]|uniref:Uncharacterized protein isoform X2 n=1 Tax=Spinacia oleracea TaxID=3562 RepID=A0ABM3QHL9_SPIOL|nr:uncharacterized protein LOC110784292 isoform X2 [Spinacia oleracea]